MNQVSVIYGGTLIPMDDKSTVISDAVIKIENDEILSVESNPNFKTDDKNAINAKGGLILPGLINGHTHMGMTLFRGLGADKPILQWLNEIVFPLEKKWVSKELVETATQLALVEMIRSGTTTFNDMYYYEQSTIKVAHEMGVRGICSPTVIDLGDIHHSGQLSDLMDPVLEFASGREGIYVGVAPHSPYGLNQKTLEQTIEYCEKYKLRLHIHLSESKEEVKSCLKEHGSTPVGFLEEINFLDLPVIAAHCCCVNAADIKILAEHNVGVIHNPESNMKLGNPTAPILKLMEAGVAIGLGTDGVMSNNNLDLFQEVDFAAKMQSQLEGPGSFTVYQALSMMTKEGARALHLEKEIGSVEVGKKADLIVVDTNKAHSQPLYDPISHIVYSAVGSDVQHVVAQGKALLTEGVVNSIDEKALLKEVGAWAKKIHP